MKKTGAPFVLLFFPLIVLVALSTSSHASLDRIAPTIQAFPGPDAPFNNIVVIMMENKNLNDIIGNPNATYETRLARDYAYPTNYKQVSNNGSLAEYLGVLSGNPFDGSVTSAAWGACNSPPSSPKCSSLGWPAGGDTSTTLVQRFESNGITWKAYMENMPSNCYQNDAGNYTTRHDPFIYFSFAQPSAVDCSNVVPAGTGDSALLGDLASSTAPNFMWLTPNICNDMSNCTVSAGDSYLQTLIPQILNSHIFTHNKATIFITWDECNTVCDSKLVPAIWAGSAVKNNFTSTNPYTHYSLTKTIELAWGLSPLTFTDACASVMTEFFPPPQTGFQSSLSCTPSHPFVGKTVGFIGNATGGTKPYSFSWNFGDNATATGTNVSHTYTIAGHYLVTLTTADASSKTAISSETIPVQDFRITPSSPNVIVNAGTSGTAAINITALGEFSGTVTVAVMINSTNLSCTLTSTSIVGGSGTSTLSCTGSVAGNYLATVTGTSGALVHSATVTYHVQDFKITANPLSITSIVGSAPNSTITMSSLVGFSGNVSLTATVQCSDPSGGGVGGGGHALEMAPMPSCPALSLSPPVIFVSAGASVFSILTVNGSSVSAGNYIVTVTGTSGSHAHSVLVNVTFTISGVVSQAPSLTADSGSNGASTLVIGGFTFELIGLVLPLLALVVTAGSRNTRTRNVVHDSFTGHQNNRNSYRLVLVPSVGYVQVWKTNRDS